MTRVLKLILPPPYFSNDSLLRCGCLLEMAFSVQIKWELLLLDLNGRVKSRWPPTLW